VNLELRLSYSAQPAGALQANFAANVGSNLTVALNRVIALSSEAISTSPGLPTVCDIRIPLDNPFSYDPAKGDLLVDWYNKSGGGVPPVDAKGSTAGEVSRVFTGSLGSPSGAVDPGAEIIEFVYDQSPIVGNQFATLVPAGGPFQYSIKVTATSSLNFSTIYYTLDGTIPNTNSPVISKALVLTNSARLTVWPWLLGKFYGEPVVGDYVRTFGLEGPMTGEWRARYFGPGYLTNSAAAGDADPDGDGVPNAIEFRVGTDPLNSKSGFMAMATAIPRIQWQSVPGQPYLVLKRDSLTNLWAPAGPPVTSSNTNAEFLDYSPGSTAFYQVIPVISPTPGANGP